MTRLWPPRCPAFRRQASPTILANTRCELRVAGITAWEGPLSSTRSPSNCIDCPPYARQATAHPESDEEEAIAAAAPAPSAADVAAALTAAEELPAPPLAKEKSPSIHASDEEEEEVLEEEEIEVSFGAADYYGHMHYAGLIIMPTPCLNCSRAFPPAGGRGGGAWGRQQQPLLSGREH